MQSEHQPVFPNQSTIQDWKPQQYHTGAMVKYNNNIFKAVYWCGKAPGQDINDGWRLHKEIYSANKIYKSKVIGYLPTWRTQFDYKNPKHYESLTHVIIAFLEFDEKLDGMVTQASAQAIGRVYQDIKFIKEQGKKIMIAVGGAADQSFFRLLTQVGQTNNNTLVQRMAKLIHRVVFNTDASGVDLDLQGWWCQQPEGGRKWDDPHPAGIGLQILIQKLRKFLGPDKIISSAVFGTSWYGNNYTTSMVKNLDWIGIMCYDLTGSWNRSPVGPHSALYKIRDQQKYLPQQQGEWPDSIQNNPITSVEDTLWYWSNQFFVDYLGPGRRIPRDKIVLGIPLYGYDFCYEKQIDPVTKNKPNGYKVIMYKDIIKQYPDHSDQGHIQVKGKTQRPSFIQAGGSYPYSHNIYFDSQKIAVQKLRFSQNAGCQGVMFWQITNDSQEKSLIKQVYRHSGNPIKNLKSENLDKKALDKLYAQVDKIETPEQLAKLMNIDPSQICPFFEGMNKGRYDVEKVFAKQWDQQLYIFHASQGYGFKKNSFLTVNYQGSLVIARFLNNKKIIPVQVDVNLFKANVQAQLGFYNGLETYLALVEGQIACFDFRLGVSLDTGFGIEDDSVSLKMAGYGLKLGRKVGIQVGGNYLYVDLVKLLHDDQSGQWSIAKTALYAGCPPLVIVSEFYKFFRNLSADGRQILVHIGNMTKYYLKLEYLEFSCGRLLESYKDFNPPANELKPGERTHFCVCKKLGFQGVEGFISYKLQGTDYHALFFYSNPWGHGRQWSVNNRITCQLMKHQTWEKMGRKELLEHLVNKQTVSGYVFTGLWDLNLRCKYRIEAKPTSVASFVVYNDCLDKLIEWGKIFT